METQHPHKDPLKINGKVIGLSMNPKDKFTVKVFSHPQIHTVEDDETLESKQVIGEMYRYSVELNFKHAGRKVVTVKVTSEELKESPFTTDKIAKKTIEFLENTAEEICAENADDIRIPWEEGNSCL